MPRLDRIRKFSFTDMVSNKCGKTSSSGVAGTVICGIGCLGFLMGTIDMMFFGKTIDIVSQSIIFTGIGAGLLGYRKSKDNALEIPTTSTTTTVTTETETEGGGDAVDNNKQVDRSPLTAQKLD